MKNTPHKLSFFPPLTPLVHVGMIKDEPGGQFRKKKKIGPNNLSPDLFGADDKLKPRPASCIWTFHSTFHFLCSCLTDSLHILGARRQSGGSGRRTGVWRLSSGRRLTSYSIMFMGLSLSSAEEPSGSEQSGGMAVRDGEPFLHYGGT